MTRDDLNQVYKILDAKAQEFHASFLSCSSNNEPIRTGMPCTCGYYNGHYHKDSEGQYVMDYFPIPVITVEGLCDIELDLDRISVSAKLKRDAALSYDYTKLDAYKFEAFGVEAYLEDYYVEGNSYEELRKNVAECNEAEIGFAFSFPFEISAGEMCEFVELLKREGFYY